MPRPEIDDETISKLNDLCEPSFTVSVERVGVDKKLRVLMENYEDLAEEYQELASGGSGTVSYNR